MRFTTTLAAAAAAVAPFASAHDSPMPRIVGLNMRELKTRDLFGNLKAHIAESQQDAHEKRSNLIKKQDEDLSCGNGKSCPAGYCCSGAGWCGKDGDYCYSPGCDYAYGPACPENTTPAGTNTSSVDRAKLGSVEYGGAGIYSCVQPGTVAITYDDGPQKEFTAHILDVMKSYDAKATFFITGNNINKGQIDLTDEYKSVIKRMDAEGHQIASHTWTHLDLSKVPAVDRRNQMWKNEMAIRNIVGKFPTYMRPPYSSCTPESGCEQDMADMGYHVTYFDVDTDDYNQDKPEEIQNSKDWFKGNITAGGAKASEDDWLAIGHDIHEQTAKNLTEFMLSTLTQLGYKAVTVGECLGDPKENWYRASEGSTATQQSTSTPSGTSESDDLAQEKKESEQSTTVQEQKTGSASKSWALGGSATVALVLSLSFGLLI